MLEDSGAASYMPFVLVPNSDLEHLQDYWKSSSPADRVKIQNMAFPSGESFSKKSGFNRTSSENEALRIIRLFTSDFVDFKTTKKENSCEFSFSVAPSDITSNLFLEDLERIWELKKWIPDPCNPLLHYLKPISKKENEL